MRNNKNQPKGGQGPHRQSGNWRPNNGQQPQHGHDERHWILKLREASRKTGGGLNDEDVNNIWVLYSATNGMLRRWLGDGVLLDRLRKEHIDYVDMESLRATARKISEAPLKQMVIEAR
jgi:hypothetical protein